MSETSGCSKIATRCNCCTHVGDRPGHDQLIIDRAMINWCVFCFFFTFLKWQMWAALSVLFSPKENLNFAHLFRNLESLALSSQANKASRIEATSPGQQQWGEMTKDPSAICTPPKSVPESCQCHVVRSLSCKLFINSVLVDTPSKQHLEYLHGVIGGDWWDVIFQEPWVPSGGHFPQELFALKQLQTAPTMQGFQRTPSTS